MANPLLPTFSFSLFFLLLVVSFSSTLAVPPSHTYTVGFLAPSSDPSLFSPIPAELAQQWQYAFRVALEVLNAENRMEFNLDYIALDSACDWMTVHDQVDILQKRNVIGVVGPACSGAALSAANYNDVLPFVSFAATLESLSDRQLFPNFFRTVYSDTYQASAIRDLLAQLDFRNATILCSKSYYSLGLADSIQRTAGDRVSSMKVIELGENSTINVAQLTSILNSLDPRNIVILAVAPLIAKDIWKVAVKLGKTTHPWRYFGTDGATAFSLEEDSTNLGNALRGEIGLAPYSGVDSEESGCKKFYRYWKEKSYPGLGWGNKSSLMSYVPYVIDTVAMFFNVVSRLQNASIEVNATTVLASLKGNAIGSPDFIGCTGSVQLDPATGSRKITPDQPPLYDSVSFVHNSWEVKGRVRNGTVSALQPLQRPNAAIETKSLYGSIDKMNQGENLSVCNPKHGGDAFCTIVSYWKHFVVLPLVVFSVVLCIKAKPLH